MQMKALRSANLAKLSSSNATRDEYWATSISAGTPAGYCLSQIRSMVFPSGFTRPRMARDRLVFGSIEHCAGRWQAAARNRPSGRSGRDETALSVRRGGGLLVRRLGLAGRALGFGNGFGFSRLRSRLVGGGD